MEEIRLWEIYVPCSKNNGTPYRVRHHRAWDIQVQRIAGGLTVLKPAFGKWTSPTDVVFDERVIPVRIACTDEQMDEIIARTLNHYPDQEAVMAYVVSDEVRIVHRDKI